MESSTTSKQEPGKKHSVSIPFKREGTWKEINSLNCLFLTSCISFNSLQTGRYMESKSEFSRCGSDFTFQFPSNGKEHGKFLNRYGFSPDADSFNSLQTGRSMERDPARLIRTFPLSVSIPFKREGAWKVQKRPQVCGLCHVSIPFKREGAWKAVSPHQHRRLWLCFNSLQTGRSMERQCIRLRRKDQ